MTTPHLDYYTAEPILLLLLAQQEIEEPDIEPQAALEIFRDFLALPYDGKESGTAFRALLTAEGPDGGTLSVSIARRVNGPPAYVEIHRASQERDVGLLWEFDLEATGDLETQILWSKDFPTIEDFFDAVRASPTWQFALSAPAEGVVFVRDPLEEPW